MGCSRLQTWRRMADIRKQPTTQTHQLCIHPQPEGDMQQPAALLCSRIGATARADRRAPSTSWARDWPEYLRFMVKMLMHSNRCCLHESVGGSCMKTSLPINLCLFWHPYLPWNTKFVASGQPQATLKIGGRPAWKVVQFVRVTVLR